MERNGDGLEAQTRWALLVEDEALVAMVAEDLLNDLGFQTRSCISAGDALRSVERDETLPALAVIDVGLPDMRGDELTRRLRIMAPAMKVIVASGYDPYTLQTLFSGDPNVTVMSKPYGEEDLARAVVALGFEIA